MGVHKISLAKLKKLNNNGNTYKNFPLWSKTTFKIGGIAKFYLEISTLENFLKVMLYLGNETFFIIGNGSKLLVSDRGYDGIVIKLNGAFDKILVKNDRMEVGAGVLLSKAILFAKQNGLGGIEKGLGIPATIGGAVVMNAGAYDFDMSQVVDYVVAYKAGKIRYFSAKMCKFGYRESIFAEQGYVILRVGLKLRKVNISEIDQNILEVTSKRKDSQPVGYLCAGSVFKRIDGMCVSQMLDELNIKGMRVGDACVSDKHANFIVNICHATADEVYTLINNIKQKFEEKYDICLSSEIIFLGEYHEINR